MSSPQITVTTSELKDYPYSAKADKMTALDHFISLYPEKPDVDVDEARDERFKGGSHVLF